MANRSTKKPPEAPPDVSDAMVEAGLRVLCESGAVEPPLSADSLLVRHILEAALLVQRRERKQAKRAAFEAARRWAPPGDDQ